MTDAEKLKVAEERIKAIIKEYDLAATVILAAKDAHSYWIDVDASWSCAFTSENKIKIHIDVADYPKDGKEYQQRLRDTFTMLNVFGIANQHFSVAMFKLIDHMNSYKISLS